MLSCKLKNVPTTKELIPSIQWTMAKKEKEFHSLSTKMCFQRKKPSMTDRKVLKGSTKEFQITKSLHILSPRPEYLMKRSYEKNIKPKILINIYTCRREENKAKNFL